MRDLAVGRQQGEQALLKQSMHYEFEKLLKQQLETKILGLSEQVQSVKQTAEHTAQKLGFELQVRAARGSTLAKRARAVRVCAPLLSAAQRTGLAPLQRLSALSVTTEVVDDKVERRCKQVRAPSVKSDWRA